MESIKSRWYQLDRDLMMRTCDFDEAVKVLRAGEPLIFPTDTVVGIGVAVEHADGTAQLASLKGRDAHKPIAWLVDSSGALDIYGDDVPACARKLADAFWPGALTLVIEAADGVPQGFRTEYGTIGLRMPDDGIALRLIEAVGCPIAATSANMAGHLAPRSIGDVDPRLASHVACLDATSCLLDPQLSQDAECGTRISPRASTVIDCTSDAPSLIREGTIRYSEILRVAES